MAKGVDELGVICEICSLKLLGYKLRLMEYVFNSDYVTNKEKDLKKIGWSFD